MCIGRDNSVQIAGDIKWFMFEDETKEITNNQGFHPI